MNGLKNLSLLNTWYPNYRLGEEYYGNNLGEVYKKTNDSYRKMSPYKNRDGYIEYVLTNIDKKKKHIMGHIVCATLFVSGRTVERNEVNHNDGNRSNNKAYNLTWLTHAENIQHSYRELRK